MRARFVILIAFALACIPAPSADWLNAGSDARLSSWQPAERELTPASVSKLRLIWKRPLAAPLSAPVILGRLITHRGTVELIFVTSATGEVAAVDGDFGTVFWKRDLHSAGAVCPGSTPTAPAITPPPAGYDLDDDGPQPLRPVYILTLDNQLHALDPRDGSDVIPARAFLPPHNAARVLYAADSSVHALAATCGSVGTPKTFSMDPVHPQAAITPAPARTSPLAAWDAPDRSHWTAVATPTGFAAHRNRDRRWNATQLRNPAVANGVVFALSTDPGHVELHALDATTGASLYRSTEPITGTPSALAIANGHVCFTAGTTLYCFGFPVDI